MKRLIVLVLIAGTLCAQESTKELPREVKIQLFSLWNEIEQDESLYWFCMYWAERYKSAELLPEKEWQEFQNKEAPRTIGDRNESYAAHWSRRASEYKDKKGAARRKLLDLMKTACGLKDVDKFGGVVSQGPTGEVRCGF